MNDLYCFHREVKPLHTVGERTTEKNSVEKAFELTDCGKWSRLSCERSNIY